MAEYKVLIACRDDESDKAWKPGDTMIDGDLPARVISTWLTQDPPVLEPKKPAKGKVNDGSDDPAG